MSYQQLVDQAHKEIEDQVSELFEEVGMVDTYINNIEESLETIADSVADLLGELDEYDIEGIDERMLSIGVFTQHSQIVLNELKKLLQGEDVN